MSHRATPVVLILGYVWPEPNSSAAGLRGWNLIRAFQRVGWKVVFGSSGRWNEHAEALKMQGLEARSVEPNDPSFDRFVAELSPDYVIFDRFMIEEQFGWRVAEHSPASVRVLDTIDLHFLRRAREAALKADSSQESLDRVFCAEIDLQGEDFHRELAAIHRSDLTLILSSFEMTLLQDRFRVDPSLLQLWTLGYPEPLPEQAPSFENRRDFSMIGNFRHAPNRDGILWFRKEIWPRIRRALPDAEAHIYGAYAPKDMMSLDDERGGFRMWGWAPDPHEALRPYRVNLAPLRFGAGIKGKIADGWCVGTPVVSTPIGREGMDDTGPWGGETACTAEEFAEKSIQLYQDQARWQEAQRNGYRLLQELFSETRNEGILISALERARQELASRRKSNWIGGMLQHHLHRSTTYFSKWIELKNQGRARAETDKSIPGS